VEGSRPSRSHRGSVPSQHFQVHVELHTICLRSTAACLGNPECLPRGPGNCTRAAMQHTLYGFQHIRQTSIAQAATGSFKQSCSHCGESRTTVWEYTESHWTVFLLSFSCCSEELDQCFQGGQPGPWSGVPAQIAIGTVVTRATKLVSDVP
jgi:hypothetical protein